MPAFSVNIEEVVDLLRLERNPKSRSGASSFDVRCPFCSDSGYHLNINTVKNTYHCVKCMDATRKNTGVLDLYGRVALDTPLTGSNGRKIYRELMNALGRNERDRIPSRYERQCAEAGNYQEIIPASDEKLNTVYSALLKLPYLELTAAHRENLLQRGLTEEEIAANGYASMTLSSPLLIMIDYLEYEGGKKDEIRSIREFYQSEKVSRFKDEQLHFTMYTDDDIILGLKIAVDVIRMTGVIPDHVPGFYKLKGKWAFRSVDNGILIPTRNEKGQIVGLQTRRDVSFGNGLRYMTVSSKGLPAGVTTSIARAHFPFGEKIESDTTVILTEGPLKSDAALSLFRQLGIEKVAFVALQGVNSTRDLPRIAQSLQEKGIREVKDGFDADKLVNPSVFQAMKNSQRILRENGNILLKPLFWDRKYAELKRAQMEELCRSYDLRWTGTGQVYADLVSLSALLERNHMDFGYIEIDGIRRTEKWNSKTKGIDDYLLSVLETRKATGPR